MANTELENNIDLALQKASTSVNYADTILGNTPLDENEGININLDVAKSAKFKIEGSTFVIDTTQPDLPYVELEYIESTGTQYIDTFIQGNNTTKVDIRFDSSKYSASSENCVLGSRIFSETSMFILGFYSRGWYGYGTAQGSPMILTGGIYEVRLDRGKFYSYNTTTSEWELKNTYTSGTFTTPSNMILFGERRSNTVSQLSSIKFYYCKIFNNDILVRDFIPVKRKSDNEICLYDRVTEAFFTNAGTGNFIAGPEI